jgi:hypothetical protein
MTILSNATVKKDDEDEPSEGEKIFDQRKSRVLSQGRQSEDPS